MINKYNGVNSNLSKYVTGCNTNLQRLQGVLKGFRGLPGIAGGYKGLKGVNGVTRGNRGLQGVTWAYRGFQGVRVSYNKQLGNYASHTEEKLISFKKVSSKLLFTIKMKNVTNHLRVIY